MTQFDMGALMGQIDDCYILEAFASYNAGLKTVKNNHRSSRRSSGRKTLHAFRAVLIAAAISAAFITAVYAMGLFGLRDSLIPESKHTRVTYIGKTDGTYLSLAGITGSAEYEASAEWILWHAQYEAEQPEGWADDDWVPADEEAKSIAMIYPCYNDVMLSKLREIAEKYSLKLHTLIAFSNGMDDFYALAGTENFALDGNHPTGGYIYEDGSFRLDGRSDFTEDGLYSLLRNTAGTLPPMEQMVWNDEGFVESSYITKSGADVIVELNDETHTVCVFYQSGSAFLLLSAQVQDELSAHKLVDSFDFVAACSGEPRVTEMLSARSNEADAADAVTLDDFAASPEYMAMREFIDSLRSNGRIMGNYSGVFPVKYGQNNELIGDLADKLCEKYGLNTHTDVRQIFDYKEACQAAGLGDFVFEPNDDLCGFWSMDLYEDGSFNMNHGFFYYIRKGSLCTDSQYVSSWLNLPEYSEVWQYETASGAVVCCASGGGHGAMLLYETPTAWVVVLGGDNNAPSYSIESVADGYDFAQLP